jgi:hypothetical protein
MAYFVEMAQTNASASGTINANMPDHVVDDYLIAYVTVDSGTITLPAGWAALPSAPANPVSNGTITYLAYVKATSTSMTFSGVTVGDAYTCGIYCFRDVDTTTPFDGVTPLNASAGAAAVTVTCSAVTTTTANALVVYMCAFDGTTPQAVSSPGVMWIDGFDSTGTTATTSSHQAAAWYITRSAGASPTATFLCNASNTATRVTFALRNKSGGRVPAYIDDVTSPATMITPCHHTAAVNNVTFTGTLTNTASVNGKTVAGSTPTLGADFGINPYANAVGRTAAITAATALNGFEITLTGGRNLSTGLVMGSLIALSPKSGTFGLGSTKQGGMVCRIGSSATAWEAHQIAAKDTNITTEQRYVFAIKPGDLTTDYGTPGTAVTTTAVTYMQFLMNCPAFAANIYLSELHQVFTQVIAGGDSTTPINIDSLAAVGRSFRLPVFQKAGPAGIVSFAPIQIGGGDAVDFQIDSGVIQFPKIYDPDTGELALHVPTGTLGLSLAGKSGDVVKLTNSLITSPSLYYFEINSAATSAATWDLAGSTIIGATVTLRPVVTFDSMAFTSCPTVTTTGSTITNASFINSKAVASSPANAALISNSSFTKTTGTQHAIEITGTAANMTLTNVDFSGYAGSNGSTGNEAVYVNIASGSMNLTISGGNTPSVRTAGASVTVVSGAVTATARAVTETGSAIQNARVHLEATAGGPFPANASVTISNSGTTATVTHTAHGMATNDKVVIRGASLDVNNGVFSITSTGANSYTYTMGSTPGSSPTGTITSTFVVLNGLTDANGEITMSRVFTSDQPVTGQARKSSGAPYYKNASLTGSVDSAAGGTFTAVMISDD